MSIAVRKVVLAALSTTLLVGICTTAQAAVLFDIVGGGPVPSFNYGTPAGDSNVVNAAGVAPTGSTVFDPGAGPAVGGEAPNGPAWVGSTASSTAVLSVSGLTAGQGYTVGWTYIGNEAVNTNNFNVVNSPTATIANNGVPAGGQNGDNRNNNCCNSVNPAPVIFIGSTLYNNGTNTISTPGFKLTDLTSGGSVTNNGVAGSNPAPNGGASNLIFAYLTPDNGAHAGIQWDLTTTPTNTVIFGFNDNGSGDDNHDDWVGIAQILPGGLQNTTPIPGALPLFGGGFAGLFGLLRWRRKGRIASTVA